MNKKPHVWTDQELWAWLDEDLPADHMTHPEQQIRNGQTLQLRISQMTLHRDHGGHSVAEVC